MLVTVGGPAGVFKDAQGPAALAMPRCAHEPSACNLVDLGDLSLPTHGKI